MLCWFLPYNNMNQLWSESESLPVTSNSLRPRGLYSPWNSSGQNTAVDSCSLLQGIFPTQASCFAGRFFTSWATRGAQEYWSLSLLQGIFLTQELNRGLLHGRWILYQLNYEGSWKTYKLAILEDLQTSFPSSMREARISYKYTYIPSLNFPPNPLGCYRAQGWAPCVIQQLPTSYLFYIW